MSHLLTPKPCCCNMLICQSLHELRKDCGQVSVLALAARLRQKNVHQLPVSLCQGVSGLRSDSSSTGMMLSGGARCWESWIPGDLALSALHGLEELAR